MNGNFELGGSPGSAFINWSWAVVFALIVWSLAAAVFPEQNPGSDGVYLVIAVVAAVLFFTSLVLHELGRPQALREAWRSGITLWLFGGVAEFKGRFPSAGAEFRVAIACARLPRSRRGVQPPRARGIPERGRRGRCLARLHQPDAAPCST